MGKCSGGRKPTCKDSLFPGSDLSLSVELFGGVGIDADVFAYSGSGFDCSVIVYPGGGNYDVKSIRAADV